AAHVVGQFGGGDVQRGGDVAVGDQALHRAPACAGGMKDQHFIACLLHHLPRPVDGGGGVAKHRGSDQRFLLPGGGRFDLHHACNSPGGVGKDGAADAVETGHIDDRGDEDDVLSAGKGADIAAAYGRDHHLGHTYRQDTHGRGGNRG